LITLKQILLRWMRWYRLRRALDWTFFGLLIGLASGFIGGSLSIVQGWLLKNEFLLISGICAVGFALVAGVVGYLWPTSGRKTAIYFDRVFNLKERLSTALELEKPGVSSIPYLELASRQLADTLEHVHQIDLHRKLPIRLRKVNILGSLLLILAILMVSWRGEHFFKLAAIQRQIQAAIADQIAQIEDLRSEVNQNEQLIPESRDELLQTLDQAVNQLEHAQSAEEAVSILTETEAQLQSLADPQAQERSQALQEAGDSLSQQDGSPLESIGEQLAAGELGSAAQEISEINISTLTGEERQALADQLEETAQALGSTNPELAESLTQAADALRSGDDQTAQEALAQAAQSIQQTGQQAAQSAAAQQAASQIAQGQQQVLQAGQSSDNLAGQGSSTAGAGDGEGDNADAEGPEAGEDPISQNNSPSDGGERPYQPIYPPERLEGTSDDLLTLPTSSETGEIILGEGNVMPGVQNRTTVPYTQVYAVYSQVYRQAVENGDIPPSMRNLVRDYFASLAP